MKRILSSFCSGSSNYLLIPKIPNEGIMANTTKKKPAVKIKKLTAEEQAEKELAERWDQAEEQSKEIIFRLFDAYLPINFTRKDIDLEKSTNWRVIARDSYDGVPASYQDGEELPDNEYLAEEITYHYLLTVLKRFTNHLSDYACHSQTYFEQLIAYEN